MLHGDAGPPTARSAANGEGQKENAKSEERTGHLSAPQGWIGAALCGMPGTPALGRVWGGVGLGDGVPDLDLPAVVAEVGKAVRARVGTMGNGATAATDGDHRRGLQRGQRRDFTESPGGKVPHLGGGSRGVHKITRGSRPPP